MAEERTVILNVDSKKAEKNVESLNAEIKQTSANLDGVKEAADNATGGAITKFNGLKGSLKSVTAGFKTLRGAIIASGIGALVIGITAVVTAFKASEKGQNQFAKLMGVIGSITGNFVDLLADLGELIIRVFTDPISVLKDFANSIQTYVIKQFNIVTEGLGFIGSAIKKVFSGDFSGALEDAGKGLKKLYVDGNPAIQVINGIAKSVSGLTKELTNEAKLAAQVADQRAEATKRERELIVERAKAERTRADLLEKAVKKDEFTQAERIAFLEEAARLEEELTNKAIEAARLKLEAKKTENTLARSTKEDLEEEAQLEAELINLETQRLLKSKETTSQIIALKAEEKAIKDAEAAEEKAKQDEADALELQRLKDKADAELAIRDAVAISQAEKDALEIQKAGEKYDALIAKAKQFGLDTAELERAKEETISNLKDDFASRNSANEIKWEELTQTEKNMIVAQGLNNLSTILGKESAAGKAAAIAAATIQTYESATASYKSLAGIPVIGPALGAAAAGAAIVSGLANVKKIVSTKTPQMASAGGSVSGGGSPSTPPQSTPPSFNVVGGSTANQLGDVIAEQTKKPVKAYVTSNDVTTAQSLDRNIVDGAAI